MAFIMVDVETGGSWRLFDDLFRDGIGRLMPESPTEARDLLLYRIN